MIYFIYGDEKVIIEKQLAKIIADTNIDSDCIVNNDALSITADDFCEEIITPSFFCDKKIIILNKCDFMKTKKGSIEYGADKIMDALNNVGENIVIFTLHNNKFADTELSKMINKQATVLTAMKVTGNKLIEGVMRAAESRNVELKKDAAEHLVAMREENLADILTDLDIMKNYTSDISIETINKFIEKPITANVFDILKSIADKNNVKLIETYTNIVKVEYMEIPLVATLLSQLGGIG
jgi:DNA polymerase-3 subunit delta